MYIKDYNKTALIYQRREISYAQTIAAVKTLAAGYQLKKGERAAIFSENRPEWVYALFSVWEKSGIAVPIDYLSPADEVGYILNDCRPEIVFCSAKTKDVLNAAVSELKDGYRPKISIFEEPPKSGSAPVQEPVSYDVHDTAIIIYTSGTTGSPKGVMLTHDNLHSNIEAVVDGAKIYSARDRLLAILPFHHIFPLMGNIMAPLSCGGTLVILEKISSEDILNAFKEYKITIVIGVPRLYRLFHKGLVDKINASPAAKILLKISRSLKSLAFSRLVFKKAQQAFGGSITYFVSGGAKLDEQVGGDLYAMGFEILEGFGMTEAAPMITFTRPGQVKIGSPGTPTTQTEVRIEGGEVLARGRNIMKGYYNKPEETAAILKNGWLHTGDQGYLDGKDRLYITGRKKEIIVLSNGKNINPEEIENRILSISPLIKEIGVYPKDEKLGAVIHPDLLAVKKEQVVNLRETIKWLVLDKFNLTVPSYKKIHHFTLVTSELPKTRLGKLKRFLLPQMDQKTAETHQAKPDPDTDEYRALKKYLEKALDQKVWPEQHLEYDLGLDSLGKIELDLFLEKTFGLKLEDEESVAHHTVEGLSRVIAEKRSQGSAEVSDWHSTLQEKVDFELPSSIGLIRFLKIATTPLFCLYFRLSGIGQDRLPPAPFILAPNHQSFLDGLFLSIFLPNQVLENTYFLTAGKHVQTPFARFSARHSNMLVMDINRDLKKTLQQAAAAIRAGKNLAIFPEGARSRDGNLQEFKKTFAILSKELQVPVVPVAVSGAYAAFPIGRKIPKSGKITLKFLPPIYPGEMDYQQIADKTREVIAGNL
ncbi:AMP-binding protein [candidate division TA06 bacterium]|nr:AMP-binding protein [candidate division TA06 bacterium]